MKETKFTANWQLKMPKKGCFAKISGDHWGDFAKVVVRLDVDSKSREYNSEGWANARLIAEAPAMYETLVKFCDACNKYNIEALVPEYEAACAILNRINP